MSEPPEERLSSLVSEDESTSDTALAIYQLVGSIPRGKVTTYGDLARAAGIPRDARRVGWILNSVPADLDLPCHRVVNRRGELSGGWAFGHPDRMRQMLENEGVRFIEEYRVDMQRHHWFPGKPV